jgi:hypothetical protein
LAVSLSAVPLEEALIGAGEDIPIDVAKVVALAISAILGELLGEPEIRGAVETRYEPIDHGLGDKVEARDRS